MEDCYVAESSLYPLHWDPLNIVICDYEDCDSSGRGTEGQIDGHESEGCIFCLTNGPLVVGAEEVSIEAVGGTY